MSEKTLKCENCKKDFPVSNLVQQFDYYEPTTIHVFCSHECSSKWKK